MRTPVTLVSGRNIVIDRSVMAVRRSRSGIHIFSGRGTLLRVSRGRDFRGTSAVRAAADIVSDAKDSVSGGGSERGGSPSSGLANQQPRQMDPIALSTFASS